MIAIMVEMMIMVIMVLKNDLTYPRYGYSLGEKVSNINQIIEKLNHSILMSSI